MSTTVTVKKNKWVIGVKSTSDRGLVFSMMMMMIIPHVC